MLRTLLVIALLFSVDPDPKKEGRRGNALLRQELFAEAAAAYSAGLSAFNTAEPDAVHAGLFNNLGVSLYRQSDFEGALNAMDAAFSLADNSDQASTAAYNGGGAAFRAEDLEQALARYREALLQNPANEDARFNYEFVKRQLQEQESEDQQQSDEENQEQNENQDEQQDQSDQQQDDQQQDENQDQDQQQENQPQDQDQQQEPQNQEQQQPQDQLSQEEAERILEALQNEEEQLLRQVQKMKTRPRRVEKDW